LVGGLRLAHSKDGQMGNKVKLDIIANNPGESRAGEQSKCLLKARSFEISRDETLIPCHGVLGHMCMEDDEATFEALKELCQKGNVDKVRIAYHNYTFVLDGFSFADANSNPPNSNLGAERNYKFKARNVHLDTLSA